MLVWFPTDERFERHWSTTIRALRYPCSEAGFTRADWRRKRGGFPTRQQVLADDLVRCRALLKKKSLSQVHHLLGSGLRTSNDERTYLDYQIGLERDSFFQVDSEYLSIEFSRRHVFRSASIYQG